MRRKINNEVENKSKLPCPNVKTRPSLVKATENWVPHAIFLMLIPHKTSTFWETEFKKSYFHYLDLKNLWLQTAAKRHLRWRFGCGVTKTQFAIISITKGPDHHPISRDDQCVVQAARHLLRRSESVTWQLLALSNVSLSASYLSNLIPLQSCDLLWQLLVGGISQTESTVISITECEKLPISRYNRRVFESARHLKIDTKVWH